MAQKTTKSIPDGMYTVTPHLWFNGNCKQAIDFYQKALNAQVVGQVAPSPDGKSVWHAMLKIGNSNIMMADAMPGGQERGPEGHSTMGIWLYTEDCDGLFNNAIKNGAKVIMNPDDMFWGDRMGKFEDPFGHCWAVASHQWIYTPEEMQQKQNEMMAKAR